MSAIQEESYPVPSEPTSTSAAMATSLSFKERLAQKRKELEENTTFELPVPGYDGLFARYRALGFEEIRKIGLAIEAETNDQAAGERLTAAETLCAACMELLELKGIGPDDRPVLETLGYRWTANAARDLFGANVPEGVFPRDAIMQIFPYPRDMLMMNHFNEYLEASMGYLPQIEEILRGES